MFLNTISISILVLVACKHVSSFKYISQNEAAEIDKKLIEEYNFTDDQLIELAGLSCAHVISETYPACLRMLVFCGSGRNGKYGWVCARHLQIIGYSVKVYHLSPYKKCNVIENLRHQSETWNVEVLLKNPELVDLENYDLIIDALHGYRDSEDYLNAKSAAVIENLKRTQAQIFSIDVPTGWSVDGGPRSDSFQPDGLISITVPKLCSNLFFGKHFLGGRYVPPDLEKKYELKLPKYPETQLYVKLD